MTIRRPIDIQRDSARSATIGDDGDATGITEMIPAGDRMLFVKPTSIFAYQLADQIDPGRTNPRIPDTQQKILSRGSDDAVVARTLLTAHTLFKAQFLGTRFDEKRLLELAFDVTQDIAAILDMGDELEKLQASAEAAHRVHVEQQNALRLPSIANLDARFDAFSQKARHVVHTLGEIARVFYPDDLASKWIDSLVGLFEEKFGKSSSNAEYLSSARDFLLQVVRVRNMVEHPTVDRNVRVLDYHLRPEGTIDRPSVEITGLHDEIVRAPIVLLIQRWTDDLSLAAEGLVVVLCDATVRPFGTMPISVIELPPAERRVKHQRYCYGSLHCGQVVRID